MPMAVAATIYWVLIPPKKRSINTPWSCTYNPPHHPVLLPMHSMTKQLIHATACYSTRLCLIKIFPPAFTYSHRADTTLPCATTQVLPSNGRPYVKHGWWRWDLLNDK